MDFELLEVVLVLGMAKSAASVMTRMKLTRAVFIEAGWIEFSIMGDGKCYRLAVDCPIGFFKFPLRGYVGVMAVASMVCDLDQEVVTIE